MTGLENILENVEKERNYRERALSEHQVRESSRAIRMVAQLGEFGRTKKEDFLAEAGKSMNSSHRSLREKCTIANPEIDDLLGRIQTAGRAARHVEGSVIMYADVVTDSMRRALDEMNRRRTLQREFNLKNKITPESIVKEIDDVLSSVYERDYVTVPAVPEAAEEFSSATELEAHVRSLEADMRGAAANLEFERAALLRDKIRTLRSPGQAFF